MVEVLLYLSKAGYHIHEYTYVGFGSVYYVDFVMFHKYLFIEKMICVEWGDVPRRMKFNKPFRCITLKMGAILNHIPALDARTRYLIWLDYDRSLDDEMLLDIEGCLNRVAPGSIFIVTIDARPKLPKDRFELEAMSPKQIERKTAAVYRDWFGSYLSHRITGDLIDRPHVARLFFDVVNQKIAQVLTGRNGIEFIQIFNYLYADGAPMITIGGILGSTDDVQRLHEKGVLTHKFVQTGPKYREISVPPLTIREKQWLDSRLHQGIRADRLAFELDQDLLDNYRDFYKEYPTFTESML
jgi:hypothetical protein